MRKIKKIAGVLMCTMVFALASLGSGSDDTSAEKAGTVTSTSKEEKEAASTSASTQETQTSIEEDSTQTDFVVGDILKYKGLYITYVKSENYTSDNMFMQPDDGKKYVRLEFYVENQSDSDKNVSAFDFDCYADGYECDQTYFDDDLSCSLSSGRTGNGAVYFEVPVDAEKVEVEYEYDWLESKKAIFVFEGDKDSGFVAEATASASKDAYKVGDVVETKGLKITYLSADEYEESNQFMQPDEGMQYMSVELEVENTSDSDKAISFYSFQCYADGALCEQFYGRDDALSATLSAGRKTKGTVTFSVPVDAKIVEVEFEDNIWTSNKIIFTVK